MNITTLAIGGLGPQELIIVLLIVFLLFQRQIVAGVASAGLKG